MGLPHFLVAARLRPRGAEVVDRLAVRAARAGLPNVNALLDRVVRLLIDGGESWAAACHSVATDETDPDLGNYLRAHIADLITRAPPRWLPHLAERVDLPPGTRKEIELIIERQQLPAGYLRDFATEASCALALALNGRPATDADVLRVAASQPAPMRDLMHALDRARAAERPN